MALKKVSSYEMAVKYRSGHNLVLRLDDLQPGSIVTFFNQDGTNSRVKIEDLLTAAEAIKGIDARFKCVCRNHGPYIANKGNRQNINCPVCTDERNGMLVDNHETEDEIDP